MRALTGVAEAQESRIREYTGLSAALSVDPHGSRAADGVLEHLEGDAIAHGEVVERGSFANIAAMEEDFAAVVGPDEPVALADEEPDDAPSRGRTATLVQPWTTSAVRSVADASRRRRRIRRCARPWGALR